MTAFLTLFYKEVLRFWKVLLQTVAAPILTALLYLLVFAQALQAHVEVYPGVGYAAFLIPGLAMMSILQNAFANTSSSILVSKVQGNIVDVLMPPLSALRAFEVTARHLSMTKAAEELHVTAGALSHQIRGLESLLGVKLFERGVRSLTLTAEAKILLPGLQTGFRHIHDAVASLHERQSTNVLVISTPPGFTSKWLAPRLYRFSAAHPDIDARISSSMTLADFKRDGIDVALRTLPVGTQAELGIAIDRSYSVETKLMQFGNSLTESSPSAVPIAAN